MPRPPVISRSELHGTATFRPGFATAFILTIGVLLGGAATVRAQLDSVRVWVLATSPPNRVSIRSTSGPLQITLRGPSRRTITIEDGRPVTVTSEGTEVAVVGPGMRASISSAGFRAGRGGIAVESGQITRRYHGRFVIDAAADGSGLQLVNHVALADYLASVIPSEYPFEELEGTKAQAVIARTYAVHGQSSTGAYDLTDNTASQAYRGIALETDLARRAVRATRGQILTYDGRPIEAVYSASGGGHTADNEDVWNAAPVPYLRGKRDPYDRASPHQEWRFAVSKSTLHALLSEEYGFTVRDVVFNDRTAAGRHRTVTLRGSRERQITGNSLRLVVAGEFGARSLKSTRFRVTETDMQYMFEGQGFGHGVGLSQWGTHARAKDGQSYEQILQFYYTGVALETLEGKQIAAAEPAPAPEEEERREPAQEDEPKTTAPAPSRLHGGWASRKPAAIEQVQDRPVRPGW